MKRTIASLLDFVVIVALAAVLLAPNRSSEVLDGVAADIAAAIPRDVHLRILAVGAFEGNGGSEVRERLANALGGTDFVLVERAKIDELLKEQGFQAGDLVDPGARVRFGEMLGAEGILFGHVERFDRSRVGTSRITVQATLADVQQGTIVLAKRFERESSPALARILFWLVTAVALLIVIELWGTGALSRFREWRFERSGEKREDAVSEIRHADRLLGDLQTQAARTDERLAEKIRGARSRLSDLRALAETAAAGDPQLQALRRDGGLLTADAEARRAAASARRAAERLAVAGQLPTGSEIDALLEDIRAAEAAYRGRTVR